MKIKSIIIAMTIIVSMLQTVSASSSDNITIAGDEVGLAVNVNKVPCRANALIFPSNVAETAITPADIAGVASGTFNIYGKNTLVVKLKSGTASGEYTVLMNIGGVQEKRTFFYASEEVVAAALRKLNSATAATVASVVSSEGEKLGISDVFSGAPYSQLTVEGQKSVLEGLTGQNFPNVNAVRQKLIALVQARYQYEESIRAAVTAVNDADAQTMAGLIGQYAGILGLDKNNPYGYKLLTDANSVHLTGVYEKLAADTFSTAQQVKDSFNSYVMLAALNQASYGQLPGVIDLYAASLPGFSTTDLTSVHEDDLQAALRILAVDYTFDTPQSFVDALKSEIAKAAAAFVTPPPASSGSTGRGGGSITLPMVSNEAVNTPPPTQVQNSADPGEFTDIAHVQWAHEAINALQNRGVLTGDDKGRFFPDDSVTRAEFSKMLTLAMKLYNENARSSFDDTPEQSWFYHYVSSAFAAGIIKGKSETQFAPDEKITREEMALMIYRAVSGEKEATADTGFNDINSLEENSRDAIGYLHSQSVINGTGDGRFEPFRSASRAEAAEILFKVLRVSNEPAQSVEREEPVQ